MKKIVLKVTTWMVMLGMLVTAAYAEWTPSKIQNEVTGSGAAIVDQNGNKTDIVITTDDIVDDDGNKQSIKDTNDHVIKITPVSVTLQANENFNNQEINQDKSFEEKADANTESGLQYRTNEATNLVYSAAIKADNTTQFLNSVNPDILKDLNLAIVANVDTKATELNDKADALQEEIKKLEEAGETAELKAKQAELDEVLAELDKVNDPEYASADNYASVALFDVSVSQSVTESLEDGGYVEIELKVDGLKKDSDVMVLHFFGDVEDPDSVREGLDNDYENTVMGLNHEFLEIVTVDDGRIVFRMSHFSPVMVLTRVEKAEEPPVVQQPEETKETVPAATTQPVETEETVPVVQQPAEEKQSSLWLIILVVLLAVVIVCVVFYMRKKNKK